MKFSFTDILIPAFADGMGRGRVLIGVEPYISTMVTFEEALRTQDNYNTGKDTDYEYIAVEYGNEPYQNRYAILELGYSKMYQFAGGAVSISDYFDFDLSQMNGDWVHTDRIFDIVGRSVFFKLIKEARYNELQAAAAPEEEKESEEESGDVSECEKCGALVREMTTVHVAKKGGESYTERQYCQDCIEKHGYEKCAACGEYYQRSRMESDQTGYNPEMVCRDCLETGDVGQCVACNTFLGEGKGFGRCYSTDEGSYCEEDYKEIVKKDLERLEPALDGDQPFDIAYADIEGGEHYPEIVDQAADVKEWVLFDKTEKGFSAITYEKMQLLTDLITDKVPGAVVTVPYSIYPVRSDVADKFLHAYYNVVAEATGEAGGATLLFTDDKRLMWSLANAPEKLYAYKDRGVYPRLRVEELAPNIEILKPWDPDYMKKRIAGELPHDHYKDFGMMEGIPDKYFEGEAGQKLLRKTTNEACDKPGRDPIEQDFLCNVAIKPLLDFLDNHPGMTKRWNLDDTWVYEWCAPYNENDEFRKAGVVVCATTEVQAGYTAVSHRIIFRNKYGAEGEISCIHTTLQTAKSVEEACAIAKQLTEEPEIALPPKEFGEVADVAGATVGVGEDYGQAYPIDHFIALVRYMHGLIEMPFSDILRSQYYIEGELISQFDPFELPAGFNAAFIKQALAAMVKVCPAGVKGPIMLYLKYLQREGAKSGEMQNWIARRRDTLYETYRLDEIEEIHPEVASITGGLFKYILSVNDPNFRYDFQELVRNHRLIPEGFPEFTIENVVIEADGMQYILLLGSTRAQAAHKKISPTDEFIIYKDRESHLTMVHFNVGRDATTKFLIPPEQTDAILKEVKEMTSEPEGPWLDNIYRFMTVSDWDYYFGPGAA